MYKSQALAWLLLLVVTKDGRNAQYLNPYARLFIGTTLRLASPV